jgi:signal transduction histidine kinase
MENVSFSLFEISQSKNMYPNLSMQSTPSKGSPGKSDNDDIARENFYKIISHELRTPINVVLGSIQLFEMIGEDLSMQYNRNKMKVFNSIMKQNCYRLLRSVNNLIDVSKLNSGNLELSRANQDIVQSIKEIVLACTPFASEKDLDIWFGSKYDRIIFPFDRDRILRAVLNLISNAIKFTPPGGNIFIHVRKKQDKVCISVRDTGIGIPEDRLDDIFNEFVQVDSSLSRNYEGSGIGLTFVKKIAELHGGNVKVKSRAGKGSTFTIELPVSITSKSPSSESIATEYSLSPQEIVAVELSDLF